MAEIISKLMIFLGLPTLVGLIGLYMGYLAQYGDPDRPMSIEADFGLPFMLTLLLVVVLAFQTRGYTKDKVEPLVKWPKIKRTRKVIHKHVVKNDEGDDDDGDDNEKDEDAKKNE